MNIENCCLQAADESNVHERNAHRNHGLKPMVAWGFHFTVKSSSDKALPFSSTTASGHCFCKSTPRKTDGDICVSLNSHLSATPSPSDFIAMMKVWRPFSSSRE